MIVTNVPLTPALRAWLIGANDDGQPELLVVGHAVPPYDAQCAFTVCRQGMTMLSPTEEREVRALLAAHAAEPLTMPTK